MTQGILISSLYISCSAMLIVWLSLQVIKLRHRHKISIGNGNISELETAIAAQHNTIEYIPIMLLLLIAMEVNQVSVILIHLFGILILLGRSLHAKAMLTNNMALRVRAMQITIWTIILLAVANLFWLVSVF